MSDTLKWAALPAVLALTLAVGARADDAVNIDRALRKQAPEVLQYLKDHKDKNVAVLKFLVGQGDGPMRDDFGLLNRTLADRLEVALVLSLTDDDEDRLCLLTHASDVVAGSGDMTLTHRTADGRAAFFGDHPLHFRRAWGKPDPVEADAFLTGEAVVAPDWRSVRLRIQVFDRKDPKSLKVVGDWFAAAADPRTLTECDVSYVRKKGAKDPDETETPDEQVGKLDDVVGPSGPTDPPPPDKEKEWADLLSNSPVKLDVLYNGEPAPIKAGAVETPKAGDVVTFRLKNTDKKTTYGVVLKVNGESTILHQKGPALDCYKWILAPGQEIMVDGFQKDDDAAEPFKVEPPEASKGDEVNYGDNAGVVSLVVFRAAADKAEEALAQNEETRDRETRAVSRGSLATRGDMPPRSLKALQHELTGKDPEKPLPQDGRKGLIVPDDKLAGSRIRHVDFVPVPREELSLVVRYYQPEK